MQVFLKTFFQINAKLHKEYKKTPCLLSTRQSSLHNKIEKYKQLSH